VIRLGVLGVRLDPLGRPIAVVIGGALQGTGFDVGDGVWDSAVVLDGFAFRTATAPGGQAAWVTWQ